MKIGSIIALIMINIKNCYLFYNEPNSQHIQNKTICSHQLKNLDLSHFKKGLLKSLSLQLGRKAFSKLIP